MSGRCGERIVVFQPGRDLFLHILVVFDRLVESGGPVSHVGSVPCLAGKIHQLVEGLLQGVFPLFGGVFLGLEYVKPALRELKLAFKLYGRHPLHARFLELHVGQLQTLIEAGVLALQIIES